MFKLKPFRSIFVWFLIFGQNPCNSIFISKPRLTATFYAIFNGLYLSAMIYSAYVALDKSHFQIIDILAHTIIVANFVGIIECWILTKTTNSIHIDLNESLDYLATFIDITVQTKQFVRRFQRKIFCSLGVHAFEITIKSVFSTRIRNFSMAAVVMTLVDAVYMHVTAIHIIFFIDFRTFMLTTMNQKLNPISSGTLDCLIIRREDNDVWRDLTHIKIVYSKVWKITEKINQRFGCTLLIMMLQAVCNVVRVLIVMFLFFAEGNQSAHLILRESILAEPFLISYYLVKNQFMDILTRQIVLHAYFSSVFHTCVFCNL